MKRAIVAPAALPASALAEVKQWLGITIAQDDASLTALLRAGLDICEAFTGAMPLEAVCEEGHAISREWRSLATRPVQAISGIEAVGPDGLRTALGPSDYEIDLRADGTGLFRIVAPVDAERCVVSFVAGLAQTWAVLPEALRHGVVRLAAHQHRTREDAGASPIPPASVAALWQPWRRMRLL